MLALLKLLPSNKSIEEAQSVLFFNRVMVEKEFDRTAIDLNQIADMAQFRVFESFRVERKRNNFSRQITSVDLNAENSQMIHSAQSKELSGRVSI